MTRTRANRWRRERTRFVRSKTPLWWFMATLALAGAMMGLRSALVAQGGQWWLPSALADDDGGDGDFVALLNLVLPLVLAVCVVATVYALLRERRSAVRRRRWDGALARMAGEAASVVIEEEFLALGAGDSSVQAGRDAQRLSGLLTDQALETIEAIDAARAEVRGDPLSTIGGPHGAVAVLIAALREEVDTLGRARRALWAPAATSGAASGDAGDASAPAWAWAEACLELTLARRARVFRVESALRYFATPWRPEDSLQALRRAREEALGAVGSTPEPLEGSEFSLGIARRLPGLRPGSRPNAAFGTAAPGNAAPGHTTIGDAAWRAALVQMEQTALAVAAAGSPRVEGAWPLADAAPAEVLLREALASALAADAGSGGSAELGSDDAAGERLLAAERSVLQAVSQESPNSARPAHSPSRQGQESLDWAALGEGGPGIGAAAFGIVGFCVFSLVIVVAGVVAEDFLRVAGDWLGGGRGAWAGIVVGVGLSVVPVGLVWLVLALREGGRMADAGVRKRVRQTLTESQRRAGLLEMGAADRELAALPTGSTPSEHPVAARIAGSVHLGVGTVLQRIRAIDALPHADWVGEDVAADVAGIESTLERLEALSVRLLT